MNHQQQQNHEKSVSPIKEVVWRRQPTNPGFISNQRPFTTAFIDNESAGFNRNNNNTEEIELSRRRSLFQQNRQHSALQSFHREQAKLLENRKMFSRSNCNNTSAAAVSPPAAVSPSSPPSYDAYQNRRSAFELTRMQSNDSLNSERHYAKSIDSTSNIPPSTNMYASSPPRNAMEYHTSPQATVAMSSPIMARRELSNPHIPQQQQMQPPQAYHHQQPQVLVDPNTGQQYYFPAPPQPQFYYPLVPAAPMYYHQPQGYIVTTQAQPIQSQHQQQPPQSPTQPRAMFFHPHHPQQQPQPFNSSYGNGTYFVEHPPSSNVSVCGGQQEPEYFQRNQTSRHSMESGSSGSTSKHAPSTPQYQQRRRNSRDSMSSSPAPSTIAPSYQQHQHQPLSNTTSFAHMSISNIGSNAEPSSPSHQQSSNVQGKFSTTSSCTSGFASGTGESLADHSPFNNSLITNRQRPVWWGTSEPTTRIGIDEKQISPTRTQRILAETHSLESSNSPEEKTPTLPQPRREQSPQDSATSATVLGRSTPPENNNTVATETTPPKSIQKAIRMDFDFKAPVENVSEKEKTPPKLPSKTSATAFTVTFDNETVAKKSVSLQDAARQAPTSRRMARRSVPASASSSRKDNNEMSESEHQDPKHYLFNKMIQGFKDSAPTGELNVLHIHKDDMDTLSEAGTYVVDTRSRRNDLDRYIDSDSSDDETSSTVSDTPLTSARQQKQPIQIQQQQVLKSKPSPSAPTPSAATAQTRQSLLATRLQQLRDRTNAPVATKTSEPTTPSTSTKPSPPIRPCQKQQQPTASTSNNFRRGDGGRFSMRAGPSTAASSSSAPFNPPSTRNSAGSRPPFRAGLPSTLSNNSVASKKLPPQKPPPPDTPEMVAWLRRKEYDPRKSAAEARKIQQLKQREQIFQQNRSLSFHPGSSEMSFKRLQRDQRSNKSHDDLSHVGEDDEMMGHSNELEKQVDALTQKCLKSIQLIKICNQNTLSESVENLLERVVQPSEEEIEDESQQAETISDQLQRLSSAFDAIQKYFEEQRSGSVSPPTFRNTVSTTSRPKTSSVGTSRSPPSNRQQRF